MIKFSKNIHIFLAALLSVNAVIASNIVYQCPDLTQIQKEKGLLGVETFTANTDYSGVKINWVYHPTDKMGSLEIAPQIISFFGTNINVCHQGKCTVYCLYNLKNTDTPYYLAISNSNDQRYYALPTKNNANWNSGICREKNPSMCQFLLAY